jgi:hypothetical protein
MARLIVIDDVMDGPPTEDQRRLIHQWWQNTKHHATVYFTKIHPDSLASLMEQNDSFAAVIADFQEAMKNPNWGFRRWSRRGWNGPGQFIELQVPDEHSKMTMPYLFITPVQGGRVPWLASQTDMLANDWYLVEG